MLTIREEYLDGEERVWPAFRVLNRSRNWIRFGDPTPTERRPDGTTRPGASLWVLREGPTLVGYRDDGTKVYKQRYLELRIPPNGEAIVCEEVVNDLLTQSCLTCGMRWRYCRAHQPPSRRAKTFCSDETHERMVVGGLCPDLQIREEESDRVVQVPVAANLTQAALSPAYDLAEVERRLLERLAREKAEKEAAR